MSNWRRDILSIPNLLSMFRLALIPVYISLYLNAHYAIAASVLGVSCLTDLVDGKIARRFNMITRLGIILDPVADKATQLALTLCLAIRYPVLWFLAGLFMVKESFQVFAAVFNYCKGKMLMGALFTGKLCTTILFVTMFLLVLLPNLPHPLVAVITLVDAVFMIVAFVHYAVTYYRKPAMIQDLNKNA